MSASKKYARYANSDQVAIDINEDGLGFIYYKSGKICVAISPGTTSYRKSFYVFDCDSKGGLDGTILLGIDELGCGFINSTSRKEVVENNKVIVLSPKGLIVAENSKLTNDIKWSKNTSASAKMTSSGNSKSEFKIDINENVMATITDLYTMTLTFRCDAISHTIDMGAKQKRNTTYLDNAIRKPGGKILPQIKALTLVERNEHFNEECRAQNNKVHPKSENLTLTKNIVEMLENKFDKINSMMKTSPSPGTTWKSDAYNATLREIPKIPISGSETGLISTVGYMQKIYATEDEIRSNKILPANLITSKGTWKGDADVRLAITEMNPVLRRTNVLKCNSGRYSDMLVVNPHNITAQNPTGMVTLVGLPLVVVRWTAFKDHMDKLARQPSGTLEVALITRISDNVERGYERVANYVNLQVSKNDSLAKKFNLVKIDVCENSNIIQELGLKAIPSFIMYYNGRLVYAGAAGGRKTKTSSHVKPQVMLIEPRFKQQINLERVLKSYGCDSYLALSAKDACNRISQLQQSSSIGSSSTDSAPMKFDAILISGEVNDSDLSTLSKTIASDIQSKRTVICAVIDTIGIDSSDELRAVKWSENYTSTDMERLLSGNKQLQQAATVCVQKPIKKQAMNAVLSSVTLKIEEMAIGLSPEYLLAKMSETLDGASSSKVSYSRSSAGRAGNGTYIGLRMSVEDTCVLGSKLTAAGNR